MSIHKIYNVYTSIHADAKYVTRHCARNVEIEALDDHYHECYSCHRPATFCVIWEHMSYTLDKMTRIVVHTHTRKPTTHLFLMCNHMSCIRAVRTGIGIGRWTFMKLRVKALWRRFVRQHIVREEPVVDIVENQDQSQHRVQTVSLWAAEHRIVPKD